MLSIQRVLTNRRLTLALTGLTPEEFTALVPLFTTVWFQTKVRQYHTNENRQRKPGGGRTGFLKIMEDKLFSILFYYKCYPTYDLLSFLYGCNRSNACRRQQQLSMIPEATLGKKLVLPERQLKNVEDFFRAFPEAKGVFIDGTERPIQRPQNKTRQKANYSGKKKRHTRKNLLISTRSKRIGFLSPTVEGKRHDFTLLKDTVSPSSIPRSITQHLDLGFQGYQKQYLWSRVSMPAKKPRTRDLSTTVKEQNKKKASIRVLVEHAIGGVKRLRITTDVFRNKRKNFDDQAMLISCRLWNYHLAMS